MGHEGHDILIKDVLVFLFAAGFVVPVLRALRLPTVAGFLLAGVALGPYGISRLSDSLPILEYVTLSDPAAAQPFAELGVLTLLFLLGLELSFEKLWAWRRTVLGTGMSQVFLSTVLITVVCVVLGVSLRSAALIGLALALSSTAVAMQLLTNARQTATPVGRTALGVLLLQDILVAPILIFAGFSADDSGGNLIGVLSQSLVEGLLAIGIIYLLGRFLLRRLFHLAVAAGGRDFLLAITLLSVVGAAVITGAAGLSIALGAFLAGLMLGATEFRHQVEADLEPFKGLLLGLFFVTVGISLNLEVIITQWSIVLAGVLGVLVIKAFVTAASVRIFSGNLSLSVETGLLLAPSGEFAFVILAATATTGAIEPEIATLVTAVAGLSMLLTPATWALGRWLAARVAAEPAHDTRSGGFADLEGHVIIAGFGRVGRSIAEILDTENIEFVGLDTNAAVVAAQRAVRRQIFLGDGANRDVLLRVGLDKAAMLIVTLDLQDEAKRVVSMARDSRPTMPILVRVRDPENVADMYEAGATFVVPDAIEAGLQLSSRALQETGYDGQAARELIADVRQKAYTSEVS